MDINLLMKPAEKTLDVSQFGTEGDYLTLKLFPLEMEVRIQQAKRNGLNIENILQIKKKYPKIDFSDQESIKAALTKHPEIFSEVMQSSPDYDGGMNYMMLALSNGVCEDKHNLGEKILLNRDFWEKTIRGEVGIRFARFVLAEVEKYQMEMSLKK